MRKQSRLWFHLCLSSLVGVSTLVTMTPTRTPAIPAHTVAPAKNVGGALASQLQGKPVVVDIYASWCSACRNVAPTLSQLRQQYGGSVHFVVLDVSDRSTTSQAERRARELGLEQFFEANRSQTGMIAIIDPATGNILAQYRNNANVADYTSVLNAALAD
jgi:thiol-disulfide isomerase/thioredoxin